MVNVKRRLSINFDSVIVCPDYSGFFGDERLADRAQGVFGRLVSSQTAVINNAMENRAEVVGANRFFSNDRVTEAELIEASGERANEAAAGRKVLAIQDSTEINFQHHRLLLDESDPLLGPVGNDKDIGFFLHPTLVVDQADGATLGIADVQIWNRAWDKGSKHDRGYARQSLDEKESYRWIQGGKQAKECLSSADQITLVTDREGDIYQVFTQLPDERTDVLIRSRSNRTLADHSLSLFDTLEQSECRGGYTFTIVAGHKKRQARRVKMAVRFERVLLKRPERLKKSGEPEFVAVYAVEAREMVDRDLGEEKPIIWRLLTSRLIDTLEKAIELIRDYGWRWKIEELNRTLKKEGLQIESSQQKTGAALRRLTLMALNVALTVMLLVSARDGEEERPASLAFNEQEIDCLERINPTCEGKTAKQQNPFPSRTLAWAAWIIGRLGGWKGYRLAGPAGPITIKRGLNRFGAMFDGWLMAQAFDKPG